MPYRCPNCGVVIESNREKGIRPIDLLSCDHCEHAFFEDTIEEYKEASP